MPPLLSSSGKPLHAFDIETDTTTGGLDPAASRITSIAVARPDGEAEFFEHDDEFQMLRDLDTYMKDAGLGYLAGWNSAVFDIPFLLSRNTITAAERRQPRPIQTLKTALDPKIFIKYQVMPGHRGGYRATWAGLMHVDIMPAFKEFAEAQGISGSLKPVARAHGLQMIEVDRSQMHLLSAQELHDYVASDVLGTQALASRLGSDLEQWSDAAFLSRLTVDRGSLHQL